MHPRVQLLAFDLRKHGILPLVDTDGHLKLISVGKNAVQRHPALVLECMRHKGDLKAWIMELARQT